MHNEEPTTAAGYLTDEITARSEAFIQRHSAAPFFLEVAYNATHYPFQGTYPKRSAPERTPSKAALAAIT